MLKKVLSVLPVLLITAFAENDADRIVDVHKPGFFMAGQKYTVAITCNASAERKLLVQLKNPVFEYMNKQVVTVKKGNNVKIEVPIEIEETTPPSGGYLFTLILADVNEQNIYNKYLDKAAFAKTRVENAESIEKQRELFKVQPGKPVGPTDPVISPNAIKVYDWLQSLGPKSSRKLLTGQYFKADYQTYYENVVALHEKTGKWTAMLHSTYENSDVRKTSHCSSEFMYPLFYNAWHRGALLMILINPPNPWHGQGRGFKIKGQETMIPEGHSVEELFDPESTVHKAYKEILACHADNLEYFRKDDIPIIIRLFGENNGSWFWFQHGSPEVGPENFKRLWKMTVDYFRKERGMHNLLFCYEVTDRRDGQLNGLVPEMTDILGVQVGKTILERQVGLYYRFLPYGKPIVLPQLLIGGDAAMENKQYDTLDLLKAFKERNPYIVGYTPWSDNVGKGKLFSIAANRNPEKFMTDPYVLNMDETPFVQKNLPALLPVPKTDDEGTKTVEENGHAWNFDAVPESKWVKPWKGSPNGFSVNEKYRKSILSAVECNRRLHVIYHGSPFGIVAGESFSIKAGAYPVLTIRMRNYSQSKELVVHWNADAAGNFNSANEVRIPINKFELPYSEYKIDLSRNPSWKGTVKTIEIMFGTGSLTGSVEIDCICFSGK